MTKEQVYYAKSILDLSRLALTERKPCRLPKLRSACLDMMDWIPEGTILETPNQNTIYDCIQEIRVNLDTLERISA